MKTRHSQQRIFVTGIGTNVGKTVVAAILTEALHADYWKPIQAGDLHDSDTMKVQRWISNTESFCHPEAFRLNHPMSPHAAAHLDHITITLKNILIPQTTRTLIIEGAGGLMVPLNNTHLMADFITYCEAGVVLVSSFYLGSINHTLLTIAELQRRQIPILGIIFNGHQTPTTQNFIEQHTQLPTLLNIDHEDNITAKTISKYAAQIKL